MEKEFLELMKKKLAEQDGKPANPEKLKAKAGVVKDLMGSLKELMAGDLKGLKKVTVASDSPEGLKEGLEKAEEIVDKGSPEEESEEMKEEGSESSPENEDEKIASLEKELEELKAKKLSKSSMY